jgi:cell division septation protein DedD
MAYKQITPCLSGTSFNADFGSISGITDGDVLYLTFTNSLVDGCYTVDADASGFTETVVTTLSYDDCSTCLAIGLTVQFQDCNDDSNIFRFYNGALPTVVGDTYSITDGIDFVGCATIVENTGQGLLFDGTGVIFTMTNGCSDSVCPIIESPVLFSIPSPSPTPTISLTPAACPSTYCFYTTDATLSAYNGNYTYTGSQNGRSTFSGDGTSTGYIYYNNTSWCLSSSPSGSCLLQGASPCYFNCPDLSSNVFTSGVCPTPTPTPINCAIFDFNAYFDCDWEPVPTPTPSVPCDDVNFTYNTYGVTPTPTPSKNCDGKSVTFSLSGYTPALSPTPTNTPTITLTRTVDVAGAVNYTILDETFSCVSVKVLIDCNSGEEIYVNSGLSVSGTPATIGVTLLAIIDGVYKCVIYDRDDTNLSSNANVDETITFYTDCSYCSVIPTPTPTITSSPTASITPTPSNTSSQTPTPSITPSPTPTIGTTPPATPPSTPPVTPTQTVSPTPSATPNYVYVYESCSPVSTSTIYKTQIIQTQKASAIDFVNSIFKDNSDNCWTYLGRFNEDYIAPPDVNSVSYSGDYFAGTSTTTYPTCEDCQTIVVPPATYTINLSYASDVDSCGTGCDKYYTEPKIEYYSRTNSFAVETYLWRNPECTSPAYSGYYSQGANCLTVNSNGMITSTSVCPGYWYYDMGPCDGVGTAIGRSSTDLSTISNATVAVSPYTCYLVRPDTGRFSYYEPYNYNLDGVVFLENCYDASCSTPPLFSQYVLVYNSGDFATSACPGNTDNKLPNYYYTFGVGLANGVTLYSSPNLGAFIANDGYYSNGVFNWEIYGGNGVLQNQTPCDN